LSDLPACRERNEAPILTDVGALGAQAEMLDANDGSDLSKKFGGGMLRRILSQKESKRY